MSFQLIISPQAQEDLEAAMAYYSVADSNAAIAFTKIFEELLVKLKQTPQHYSYFDKRKILRSVAFLKFPYSIIFEIKDDTVFVFAVFNTRQNPDTLYKRTR